MSKMMSAVLAATAMLTAGAAAAATAPGYGDLDLGRPSDAKAYRARIDRVADRACESASGLNAAQQMFECRARTRATLTAALPQDVRTVYQAALNGQASDALARARLASNPSGAVNRD